MAAKGSAMGRTNGNGVSHAAASQASRGVASEFDRSINKAGYVDDIPLPVVVIDCDHNIDYINRAAALMAGRAGAMLTLTYLGAVRSIPSYNVMGLAKASLEANVRFLAADLGAQNIRVNAISAGPIKTLAAAGIGGFRKMLAHVAQIAPLRRNVTIEDVGNAAVFLCSDMAAGITGEILYVDNGFSTVGMSFSDSEV